MLRVDRTRRSKFGTWLPGSVYIPLILMYVLLTQTDQVWGVAFSDDSMRLVSVSDDKSMVCLADKGSLQCFALIHLLILRPLVSFLPRRYITHVDTSFSTTHHRILQHTRTSFRIITFIPIHPHSHLSYEVDLVLVRCTW